MTTLLGRDLPCITCPHPAHFLPGDFCDCTETGRPGLYPIEP
jgi:hypothetical protein